MTEPGLSSVELNKIEAAIQAQEALRGILPDEQIETTLLSLRARREQMLITLQGSGAIAVGKEAKALAQEAILVEGDIGGDFLGHGAQKIEKHYHGPEGTDPVVLHKAYLNRVLESSRYLSLAGIDPKAASEAEARLSLSAVYTALLTNEMKDQGLVDRRGKGEEPGRELRRLTALEQLNRQSRLVLLGDPGSGKSTFVNFVALCLAGEALGRTDVNLALLTAPPPEDEDRRMPDEEKEPTLQPWDHGGLLPIVVILRDLAAGGLPDAGQTATAEHLWKFITNQLSVASLGDFAPHLRTEMMESGGLLLLDGLDEVPEADRRRMQLKQAIEDFATTYYRCRILVTSRTYAYQKQDWQLSGFKDTELAPFSRGQIETFVDRWYEHIAALRNLNLEDARGRAELLKRAIFSSDRLFGLAERPLLLTLMASLHAWRGGSLPEKREQLYADTVDLLLDWWESPKAVRSAQGEVIVAQPSLAEWLRVDRDKVRMLLNELAFQAHAAQAEMVGTADVPEGAVVGGLMRLAQNPDVNPARLVEYISQRAGLLIPRGVGVYTFPHRTFQEYLAACYLTDHGYPERVAELACADPDRWREVALLAGAKAARGGAFALWSLVECLCSKDPEESKDLATDSWGAHLAAQIVVESAILEGISDTNRRKVDRIRRWLVHILANSSLIAPERSRAVDHLAVLGDTRLEGITLDRMQFCWVPTGTFMMGSDKEKDPDAYDDQLPQHSLSLHGFCISRYPVTNAQFQIFVQDGGYQVERYWTEAVSQDIWKGGFIQGQFDDIPRNHLYQFGEPFNLANHPVVGVTWYEALAFTRWLTERWRDQGYLDNDWKAQLPSEAEWEKAARGGLNIPQALQVRAAAEGIGPATSDLPEIENPLPARLYPWGDQYEQELVNLERNIGSTTGAGCYPLGASPYGVQDMSGNVWEWTRSVHQTYPYDPKDGREDLDAPRDALRVLRGGSFGSNRGFARCAFRFGLSPVYWFSDIGFRVLVSPG